MINLLKKQIKVLKYCVDVSIKASRLYSTLRIIMEIILAILPIVSMYFSKQILNIFAYGNSELLYEAIILILMTAILLFISTVIGSMKNYIAQLHNEKIDLTIQMRIIEKSIEIDLAYYDSNQYYNDLTNANINSSSISMVIGNLYYILFIAVKGVTLFYIFLSYSIFLPITLIALNLPFALVENYYKKQHLDNQKEMVPISRRMGYILNIFTNRSYAIDIRTNHFDEFLKSDYLTGWTTRYTKTKKINKKHMVLSLVFSNIPQAIIIIFTILLSLQVFNSEILVGDYTYITGCAQQLLSSMVIFISSLARYNDGINRSTIFIDFMLNDAKTIKDGSLVLDINKPHKIEFVNVSFKYPGTTKYILEKINFTFFTNEKVALVGQNGEGKTTLIKLILRLYDVDEGEILIDEKNIKEYKLDVIRNLFSIMPQNYNNYSFKIKDNIALSNIDNIKIMDQNTIQQIVNAIKDASAESILNKASNGLETYLTRLYSDDGIELSGGEWQKIAMARCFFKKSEMMILDEPSSSMDAKSEAILFDSVINKSIGLIMISHKLSNVNKANRIFVLYNSKIVENGTHEELMEQKGIYFEMYNMQLKKYL